MGNKIINCKACGKELAKGSKCPNCGKDNRNFFMKHKIITGILGLFVIGIIFGSNENPTPSSTQTSTPSTNQEVADNNTTDETDTGTPVNDTPDANKEDVDNKSISKEESVPTEYKSALKKAKNYSDIMSMSKIGIYNQLVSEYGDKFSAEAAQYAIDNLQTDYNANALKKAKTYQNTMNMSPNAIYDQLISEYGERFTEEEAQYAIDNLE